MTWWGDAGADRRAALASVRGMTSRTSVRRSPVVSALLPALAVTVTLAVTLAGCGSGGGSGVVPVDPGTAPPAPVPTVQPPDPANRYPGDVLDLSGWYLTLPTGVPEDPDTVHQPELATYSGANFRLDEARTGVVFTANAGGATTEGSKYPRTELREMNGTDKASWSNRTGTHTMSVRGAVLSLPPVKPEVVVAQIHDEEDDVLLVRVERDELVVEWDDGDSRVVLDPAYRLGTTYDLRIVATGGHAEIWYGGVRKVDVPKSGTGWYFKAGNYLQSNPERGEAPDATAEVVIQDLRVEHTP